MDDTELLERLIKGDELAFIDLVTRYHDSLIRVARYYVSNESSAEDVAQATWLAVLRGLERFEGRSTVKTWIFRICVNRARSLGVQEGRSIPADVTADELAVSPSRFNEGGMWVDPPKPFTDAVDDALANAPLVRLVHAAIGRLSARSRAVVTLRDVEGLSTAEVAELLELSEANVRVILHRCRAKVRAEVEESMRGGGS